MNPEEFYAAKVLESDGWEFNGVSDAGDMTFTRQIHGVIFVANVHEDR